MLLRGLVLLSLAVLAAGCSSPTAQSFDYVTAYHHGNLDVAVAEVTRCCDGAMPHGDFEESDDAVWLLLDKATLRFAQGDAVGASSDYRKALEASDYFSKAVAAEAVGQLALQDDVAAYSGDNYEKVLARLYCALAFLHEGDEENAFALLRQCEDYQQTLAGKDANSGNAVAKYLFGHLLARRGDASNAKILFQEAETLLGRKLPRDHDSADRATVLILCHNGNRPPKVTTFSDASQASTRALEFFLSTASPAWQHGQYHGFALSSLPGIPTPTFLWSPLSRPLPTYATVDGITHELQPWVSVYDVAASELEEQMPVIVARGAARYLLRRGVVAAARRQSYQAGAVTDLLMLIANANTGADVRSWTALPYRLDLAHLVLCPGQHHIDITTSTDRRSGKKDAQRYPVAIDVAAGDFCIIHVFNHRPGITTTQTPKRFCNYSVIAEKETTHDTKAALNTRRSSSNRHTKL